MVAIDMLPLLLLVIHLLDVTTPCFITDCPDEGDDEDGLKPKYYNNPEPSYGPVEPISYGSASPNPLDRLTLNINIRDENNGEYDYYNEIEPVGPIPSSGSKEYNGTALEDLNNPEPSSGSKEYNGTALKDLNNPEPSSGPMEPNGLELEESNGPKPPEEHNNPDPEEINSPEPTFDSVEPNGLGLNGPQPPADSKEPSRPELILESATKKQKRVTSVDPSTMAGSYSVTLLEQGKLHPGKIIKINKNGKIKVNGEAQSLQQSDDQLVFPSSDGWMMTKKAVGSRFWTYYRIADNNLVVQQFCTEEYYDQYVKAMVKVTEPSCKGTYNNLGQYCCGGFGPKLAPWQVRIY